MSKGSEKHRSKRRRLVPTHHVAPLGTPLRPKTAGKAPRRGTWPTSAVACSLNSAKWTVQLGMNSPRGTGDAWIESRATDPPGAAPATRQAPWPFGVRSARRTGKGRKWGRVKFCGLKGGLKASEHESIIGEKCFAPHIRSI